MGIWRQIAEYFYIKEKGSKRAEYGSGAVYAWGQPDFLSFFMFLLAIIVLIIKMLFFKNIRRSGACGGGQNLRILCACMAEACPPRLRSSFRPCRRTELLKPLGVVQQVVELPA